MWNTRNAHRHDPDDPDCECLVVFSGISSGCSTRTTTAIVVPYELGPQRYRQAVAHALTHASGTDRFAPAIAAAMIAQASLLAVGDIVERRGREILQRTSLFDVDL
jgi:hypothetical protein